MQADLYSINTPRQVSWTHKYPTHRKYNHQLHTLSLQDACREAARSPVIVFWVWYAIMVFKGICKIASSGQIAWY